MSAIAYPSTLPGPSGAEIQSAERRMLTPEPFEARTVQRDRLAIQEITLPPFTADEAATFRAWFDDTLVFGGAWFSATWPLPQGFISAVRRWIGQPAWKEVDGFWQVSGPCEVRGRGLAPDDPFVGCDLLLHFDEVDPALWRDYSRYRRALSLVNPGAMSGVGGGVFGREGFIDNAHPGDNNPSYSAGHSVINANGNINFGDADFWMSGYFTIPALPPNGGSMGIIDAREQDYDGGWLWQFHRSDDGSLFQTQLTCQNDSGVSSSVNLDVDDSAVRHLYWISRKGTDLHCGIDNFVLGHAFGAFPSTPPGSSVRDSTHGHLILFGANRELTPPDGIIASANFKVEELYVNHGVGCGIDTDFSMPAIPFDNDHTLRQILGLDP